MNSLTVSDLSLTTPTESLYTGLSLLELPQGEATQLRLVSLGTDTVIGSVQTIVAEESGFPEQSGIPNKDLTHCLFVSRFEVGPGPHEADVRLLLLYVALRRGRMNDRKMMIACFDSGSPELQLASFQSIPRASRAYTVEIQRAAYQVFEALSDEAQGWVAENLLTQELETTVKRRCAAFYNNAFCRSVFEGRMTKNQYVESVANNHQFVRWTTRLLGRIIGLTGDRVLRRSYIEHLSGEIDHDLQLEKDLRHLGADVEWVRTGMVPNVHIQQFMCVQESLNAFHQDPLLFLAVPFSIEGITAFLGKDFMTALMKCIASWGIEKPSTACTFLASHIGFDGGDDGHWEGSRKMFRRFLKREHHVQRLLNVIHMVMNAVDRAYESYVELPDLAADK